MFLDRKKPTIFMKCYGLVSVVPRPSCVNTCFSSFPVLFDVDFHALLTFFVHVLHFVIRHPVCSETQFLSKCMSDQAGFTVLSLNTDILKNEKGMSTKIINFITSGTGVPMFGRRSYSENALLIKISSFLLSGADKHNECILIHITTKKWSIQFF